MAICNYCGQEYDERSEEQYCHYKGACQDHERRDDIDQYKAHRELSIDGVFGY
jgi:hypothetical protein